ncbi:hypothetical protein GUJ93_ZPchr0004g38475 [Zizania palustris]|uniref:Uncharacterized protein n=1 Tax=Zizania palustris TaxID=103762 RepID=A0A8J5T0A8_ZIZPA|nr:hypothetical protein GUJ93_ZPchr0004g38475 [Zizania palustris]
MLGYRLASSTTNLGGTVCHTQRQYDSLDRHEWKWSTATRTTTASGRQTEAAIAVRFILQSLSRGPHVIQVVSSWERSSCLFVVWLVYVSMRCPSSARICMQPLHTPRV